MRVAFLLALLAAPAMADTNLVWSPSAADRNVGSWQRAGDATPVLSGSTFGTAQVVAFGTLADTAPVYLCTADVPVGQTDGCPVPGNYTQERFAPKSQAARVVVTPPPPPPVAVSGPACYPDVVLPARLRTASLPAGVSTRYDRIAAWTCQTPTGYSNEVWLFSLSQVIDPVIAAMAGVFDETAARDTCAQRCTALTTAETAHATTWAAPYRASASVSASGSATTRPVYALNPDGTRNTTAVPNARVTIGNRCDISKRLALTSYYSVAGQPNVATTDPADTLGSVYAICTLTTPTGVNQ